MWTGPMQPCGRCLATPPTTVARRERQPASWWLRVVEDQLSQDEWRALEVAVRNAVQGKGSQTVALNVVRTKKENPIYRRQRVAPLVAFNSILSEH